MASSFDEFSLRRELLDGLRSAGYTEPTPIQRDALPPLLAGSDLIGVAETGTGKTLAFLLPIFQRIEPGGADPQALVVCPTRELALQVAAEAERFGAPLGVRTVVTYGGTSSGEQKSRLKGGCDLVVGTPGRLLDFLTSAWLSVRRIRFVVLDEADRMLDMGFIGDVDAILRRTPMSRQTMLFSATFPDEVQQLAERYMFHPAVVRMHTGTRVTDTVDHAVVAVDDERKEALLIEILARDRPEKFLVFTATREATSRLARALRRAGHDVISLSSLLSQANRERALVAFRQGECRALVATDVAARGLDVTDIDLVVNFDVPLHPEDYVHRIGRTGRATRAGKALTLVVPGDERRVRQIEQMLGQPIPRLEFDGYAPRVRRNARRRPGGERDGTPRRPPRRAKSRRSRGSSRGKS